MKHDLFQRVTTLSTLLRRYKWTASLITAALLACGYAIIALAAGHHAAPAAQAKPVSVAHAAPPSDDEDEPAGIVKVKTIRPKRSASLELSVEQPAYVEAYYRADLEARVAGPVKFIETDIGDQVKEGDRLLEIDVPDLVQAVEQKKAIVAQRRCDLVVAETGVRIAQATLAAAEKSVTESESRAQAAAEEQDFRGRRYLRFKELAKGPSPAVTPDVVDEELKWSNVAKANKAAADAGVLKAKAALEEARQKVEGAKADVSLKQSLINVALADQQQEQAKLDLATILAPFRGVVTRRTVDPGTFVHNAATSIRSTPLLTIERTDIVTVYMKVPDKYAPYVCNESKVQIELDELPGEVLEAQVTRFTPSLQTTEHDRCMRIEVDLYNGTPQEYQSFLAQQEANKWAGLKGRAKPILPKSTAKDGPMAAHRLMPGMYGKMRLVLKNLQDVFLLPSQAVVREGGSPYVYLVADGIVRRQPVAVDVDDGKVSRVRLLLKDDKKHTIRRDLNGKEEIVYTNQGELSDGQAVEVTEIDW
jgi:multidrug efflux pump subunit AcrA (membrane-fusion protein)